MVTAKNIEHWMGKTPQGDLHMKSTYFGSRQMVDWGFYVEDSPINARATNHRAGPGATRIGLHFERVAPQGCGGVLDAGDGRRKPGVVGCVAGTSFDGGEPTMAPRGSDVGGVEDACPESGGTTVTMLYMSAIKQPNIRINTQGW